jgi:hypothetical protein|tara:strand:- start:294 stop:515 length:222 start_codon:yes stop_codon:yes gene_type:complete
VGIFYVRASLGPSFFGARPENWMYVAWCLIKSVSLLGLPFRQLSNKKSSGNKDGQYDSFQFFSKSLLQASLLF